MSELGKTLKERREELGLSLSEASLSTKISARMIAAIEKGNFEALPALPFAKGFVRSYAGYLKLDPDKMVQQFVSELGEPEELEVPVYEADKDKAENSIPVDMNQDSGGMMRIFIIGGVIILIVAIVGIKRLVDKYQKEADVPAVSEVSVSPIEKPTEGAEQELTKEGEPAAPQPATPQPAASESTTTESTTAQVTPPEPVAQKEEPSQPAASQPTAPQPVASESESPAPVKEIAAQEPVKAEEAEETKEENGKAKEILLEALDRVQITISVGGKTSRVSLTAGEVHVLRTDEKVELDISDGGAVNLVVNGRSKGVPGSLGQKKQIKIP